MPGLVPGIHDFPFETWMAGTNPAMTFGRVDVTSAQRFFLAAASCSVK